MNSYDLLLFQVLVNRADPVALQRSFFAVLVG
jgi:hypothetical protein